MVPNRGKLLYPYFLEKNYTHIFFTGNELLLLPREPPRSWHRIQRRHLLRCVCRPLKPSETNFQLLNTWCHRVMRVSSCRYLPNKRVFTKHPNFVPIFKLQPLITRWSHALCSWKFVSGSFKGRWTQRNRRRLWIRCQPHGLTWLEW